MGMNLTLDGDELIMPTCGHKNKDGSIILCEECVNKIKLLQALLKQTQDILDEIDKCSYCYICGNAIINGKCFSHPNAELLTNTQEIKQMIMGEKEKK